MKALLPTLARPLLTDRLPADLDVAWFTTEAEALAAIGDVTIAWVDLHDKQAMGRILAAAGPTLRWLSTIYAGLDEFPLDLLRARDVTVTNGAGINAVAVAEYAVMGILAAAKRLDEVVRAQDRRQWLRPAPGRIELDGTSALVVGHGTIGRLIGQRLTAFGVAVTGVTRSGREGTLGPDQWRGALGGYDWIILAAPSTAATRAMIGAAELAAMKSSAWLINIARGDMIDDDALVDALRAGSIAGAFLDPSHPEPLSRDHPLWTAPNTFLTMHLSGLSQTRMYPRAADLFLDNLAAYRAGKPMRNVADLTAGY